MLRLNDRDALVLARREAFVSYRARLVEYRQLRDDGASTGKLANRTSQILNMQHPFVWAVMKRQHQNIHELNQLFSDVPEALEW